MAHSSAEPVLVVDLDGTLLCGDLLFECLARLLKHRPLLLLLTPFWVARGGIAHMKEKLAQHAMDHVDVSCLPYNMPLLHWIKGHPADCKILLSASHQSLVERVASHLSCFDRAVGSEEKNMKGGEKVRWLREQGFSHFDYVGDSRADIPVWKAAVNAYTTSFAAGAKVRRIAPIPACNFRTLTKAIRLHQWVKNVLVFVPLILGYKYFEVEKIILSCWAFLALSFVASSIYLINDLLDLEDDRRHHEKKNRGFASGRLALVWGFATSPFLLLAGIISALQLSADFRLLLAVYLCLTVAYSLRIKQIVLLDLIVLSCLYAIRILAGNFSADLPLSNWMISLSLMLFFSLACLKRHADLIVTGKALLGRDYQPEDAIVLKILGIASGLLCVLIMALYVDSEEATISYSNAPFLWITNITLLYWIGIMWLRSGRGLIAVDPVMYALKDRLSWLCLLVLVATFSLAVV